MASSTFFGIQTSLRGLLAHQRSLDVTGHNVANASTQGYSRQEAVLTAGLPHTIPAGARSDGSGAQLGTGAQVADYRRIRDGFLDLQFRAQSTLLGDADARARSLEGVDLALAEPGENGLAHQIGKLWSGFANLAGDPSSIPARQALLEQGKMVATAFSDLDRQLATISQQASNELTALTAYDPATGRYGEVAQLATELAAVGGAIRDSFAMRQQPNDLMDQRDALLDKLSKLGTVTVAELGEGGIRVLFGGTGVPLVDDNRANNPATPGDERVVWPQALSAPGGKLGALMELSRVPGGVLDTYRESLGAIATELANSVNGLHSQTAAALDFFTFDPALRGAGLSVGLTVGQIAANRTGTAGGNDLATEIAALRGKAAESMYGAFVARIGSDVNQNTRTQTNASVLAEAVEDRRQSTSGVSLDEEMTNLVRFQRGYQASARTMSTLDEMLDVLINRTGRVGL
jgi:flagellar hook-associated protein 1 FlgK